MKGPRSISGGGRIKCYRRGFVCGRKAGSDFYVEGGVQTNVTLLIAYSLALLYTLRTKCDGSLSLVIATIKGMRAAVSSDMAFIELCIP